MENLIISFNVVLPLFLCMALGYFLKRIKLCDEVSFKIINKLCFKVFLPIYLFNSVYSTDLSAAFNGKLILFAVIALLVLFGLPVATSICGEENIGATSLLLGIVVPIFNVLAVVTLETFRGGKPSVKKMIKGIITIFLWVFGLKQFGFI